MPELPEVETIKRDLESVLVGKKITDVIFLWPGILKEIGSAEFKKNVIGSKIIAVERRAKNLNIRISNNQNLLFHMKMTGHLIFTDDNHKIDKNGRWVSNGNEKNAFADPQNQFIRAIFYLNNRKILAFSDLRKFAYIKLLSNKEIKKSFSEYGPEPFSKEFNIDYLKSIFSKKNVAIKKILMDQKNIAGIGNIYADEILWKSKIHPLKKGLDLTLKEITLIHQNTKDILTEAIKSRGTSTSDFRDISGEKGTFDKKLNAYRQTGKPCPRDKTPIERISVGGRGTHFCPTCQKLENENV